MDHAGQDLFRLAHSATVIRHAVFIIVLDPRKDSGQQDARAELCTIKHHAPGALAVIVQSKSDMAWHDEVDMAALKAEFPDILAHDKVIRVSGLTGAGMPGLQAIVLDIVAAQQDTVTNVPARYTALGAALQKRGAALTASGKPAVLLMPEVESLGTDVGITERSSLKTALSMLSYRGTILSSATSPRWVKPATPTF